MDDDVVFVCHFIMSQLDHVNWEEKFNSISIGSTNLVAYSNYNGNAIVNLLGTFYYSAPKQNTILANASRIDPFPEVLRRSMS